MPKGIGYGEGAKKRAAKKSVKKINEKAGKAVSRQHGEVVQKKTASGGTIGYASVARKPLPKKRTVKTGTGSPQHKRSVKMSRKRI